MKKGVILLLVLLFFPMISAEIIINQHPSGVYNLGDVITVTSTIKSPQNVAGFFEMDLICGGSQANFYKNGVSLAPGEEKKIEASLILTKNIIGEIKGDCRIKAFLGEDFTLTNSFKISDSIIINATFGNMEFSPGDSITISGKAARENGKAVNGFIELLVIENDFSKMTQAGTINNGIFSVTLPLPNDTKAGSYLIELNAYEQDINGQKTNNGFLNQNILIKQVPTSLEIVFDDSQIDPGANLRVKAILRDQTGEKMDSLSFISIKNSNNKILDQVEVRTDEFHSFLIPYNEPPSTWEVVAVSSKLNTQALFTINKKEAIKIDILDKIVTITNVGNVPYNKTALVKIGNRSVNVDVYLEVGKSQKYILTAPEGNYSIEVSTGDERATAQSVPLTGKAVDVKKAPGKAGSLLRYPLVWLFIFLVLASGLFIFVKRSSKRNFFAYITSKFSRHHGEATGKHLHHHHHEATLLPLTKGSLIKSSRRAEISLSMKGEKQDVSLVTINIKNLGEVQRKTGGAVETLQKIVDMAEGKKATTYEDHNSIIFILSPAITKSFKNEKTALEIAHSVHDALSHHNKMFKQKIEYGVSLNYGPVIGKHESNSFKFSSIDTTISAAKKISSLANGEILLGEKINEKLRSEAKTIKHHRSGVEVYSIKELKNSEEHSKFLKSFTERFAKEHPQEHHEHHHDHHSHDHHEHHDHHHSEHSHKDHHDHHHKK